MKRRLSPESAAMARKPQIGANTASNTEHHPNLMPPWKPGQSGNPSRRPKCVDLAKKATLEYAIAGLGLNLYLRDYER